MCVQAPISSSRLKPGNQHLFRFFPHGDVELLRCPDQECAPEERVRRLLSLVHQQEGLIFGCSGLHVDARLEPQEGGERYHEPVVRSVFSLVVRI